jgi:hypothetical protein
MGDGLEEGDHGGGLMRAKAPKMSRLGGCSPPRVVQDLSLLLLAISM